MSVLVKMENFLSSSLQNEHFVHTITISYHVGVHVSCKLKYITMCMETPLTGISVFKLLPFCHKDSFVNETVSGVSSLLI